LKIDELFPFSYIYILSFIILYTTDLTLKISSDNITALKFTTKSGGTSSALLQDLVVQIQDLYNPYQLHVVYQHIAVVRNIEADKLSRIKFNLLYEATIPRPVFKKINVMWGPLKIDAFVGTKNHQIAKFWSY
jgi:hypothetical protein